VATRDYLQKDWQRRQFPSKKLKYNDKISILSKNANLAFGAANTALIRAPNDRNASALCLRCRHSTNHQAGLIVDARYPRERGLAARPDTPMGP
jgi:hypothetical protein